ncbi:RNA polymerase sigma factor [Bacillus alkalicellulosilyticus]|uniref:RNA polymerase sigma factor n=1 Tax=Alkalihalobacterium alkalicellulosilyticum TaxID=1912214 RepID=UPI00148337FD|nr:sigma factor-like helix-turn-helix DNA-binding protein [Bacillus alkalicellulosilyticus]
MFLHDYVLQFLPAKGKSTEEIVEAKEEARTVHEGLQKLKPDHKLVILLRGIHEFSVKETSQITGWTEAKVKVTYHRALKELKLILERDVACEFTRRVHNE